MKVSYVFINNTVLTDYSHIIVPKLGFRTSENSCNKGASTYDIRSLGRWVDFKKSDMTYVK